MSQLFLSKRKQPMILRVFFRVLVFTSIVYVTVHRAISLPGHGVERRGCAVPHHAATHLCLNPISTFHLSTCPGWGWTRLPAAGRGKVGEEMRTEGGIGSNRSVFVRRRCLHLVTAEISSVPTDRRSLTRSWRGAMHMWDGMIFLQRLTQLLWSFSTSLIEPVAEIVTKWLKWKKGGFVH